jgi:hypothetical protein
MWRFGTGQIFNYRSKVCVASECRLSVSHIKRCGPQNPGVRRTQSVLYRKFNSVNYYIN